jgi:superfamily II DNA/RNA helicase
MPQKVRSLTSKILNNPEQVNIAMSKPAEGVLQAAYLVYDKQKNELIKTLLEGKANLSAIIFASTKQKVKTLERDLQRTKFSVYAIHSDLEQSEREKVLLSFRNKQTQILVATNIVSRGIDIEDIGLIINYDVPDDAEDYIHRVGRTARAEATGVALTFINEHDQQKFLQIETLIGDEIKKLPLPPSIGSGPKYNPQSRNYNKPYNRRKGKPRKK